MFLTKIEFLFEILSLQVLSVNPGEFIGHLSLSCLTNPSLKVFYSFTPGGTENFEKMFENSSYRNVTFTYDLFKSMWLSVWVYYPSLEYTRIVETPKVTLLDLLTQIGGSLGLFVSFSVFTLFELIEAIFLVVRILFFK